MSGGTKSLETPLNQTGAVGFGRRVCAQGSPEIAITQAQGIPRYRRFLDAGLRGEIGGNTVKPDGSGEILALYAYTRVLQKGEGPSAGDPALSSIFGR
jgi:hypothetical protein